MGVATAPSNGFLERAFLWPKLNWLLIKIHLVNDPTTPLLLAGNETVVSKAGRHTFGLDRFFSSLRGKVISGVSFFSGYGNLTRYSRPHLPHSIAVGGRLSCLTHASHSNAVRGYSMRIRQLAFLHNGIV